MIITKWKKALKILINEALLRRLPPTHLKRTRISQDLAMLKAGLRGEEETDYYLKLLPDKEFHIFQGVRLHYQDATFQIDTLLLPPHLILLLEVKNYAGTVTFNPKFNQITREYNGKEEGFEDPIVQAKRLQYQLRKWMELEKLPPVPVDFLVAFGKATTILKNPTNSQEIYNKVCLAGNLVFKINDLKTKYPNEILHSKEIKKWSNTLLKKQLPERPTYTTYNIHKNEFVTGVQCPACLSFRMYRIIRFWKCPACGALSKDAHIPGIQDYFLLVDDSISNQQFQDFLHLPNYNIASKLLSKMDLNPIGFRKGRVYMPRSFY